VLPEVDESPVPRINSRFGHPTPRQGVQIERKWSRPDYSVPGNGNGNGLVQIQIHRK
jgi:formate dehydrogenase major subunit